MKTHRSPMNDNTSLSIALQSQDRSNINDSMGPGGYLSPLGVDSYRPTPTGAVSEP